jgi:hypothetical protein
VHAGRRLRDRGLRREQPCNLRGWRSMPRGGHL